MGLRRPTKQDLLNAASISNLHLTDEELEDYHSLTPDVFELLDSVEQMPAESYVFEGAVRDVGSRPDPKDDPYNAVVRRCSVKGTSTGKLAGVRVGLKDNISVASVPMTCGSRVLSGYVPAVDATVVQRLLQEGAEIVAMLNMDDFAWVGDGDTGATGPVLNPYNTQHIAGGSSAGSGAGLHYDYIDMTLGCDQGGSIRIPAARCGVVGLKATFGLIPYTGIIGGDTSVDHVGPMAKTVEEVSLMLEVIAGKDDLDPRQNGEIPVESYTQSMGGSVEGLKIGVIEEGFETGASEEGVDAAVRKALHEIAKLEINVQDVSVPVHSTALKVFRGLYPEGATAILRDRGLGYGWQGFYDVSLGETLGRALRTQGDDLPGDMKLTMLIATYLREHYHGRIYSKAQNLRPALRRSYDLALEELDVLALPTVPMQPFKNEMANDWKARFVRDGDVVINCAPFNVTGHPAISIPCGKVDGLPVGLMLVGKHFQESTLLKVAHAFEQSVDWERL